MDSNATIGFPAVENPPNYSISGPDSGVPLRIVTLTLTKEDGIPWADGDSVTLDDGGGRVHPLQFKPGQFEAKMLYSPVSVGEKLLAATNAQGWTDPAPFRFSAQGVSDNTLTSAISIGL